MRAVRERGWAGALLVWEWRGLQLVAEISRCRYFCRVRGREVLAWCELRDISGGRRCEIGSFRDVAAAKAACEADAQRRVQRENAGLNTTFKPPRPVSVAISGKRRRRGNLFTVNKSPRAGGLLAINKPVRAASFEATSKPARARAPVPEPEGAGDIDAAVAAVAWATEDEG
jgi:hypothetical protein